MEPGCATSPSPQPARHSLGLLTMRERAHEIGGELVIESAPGQGTRVVLQAPLVADPLLV